MPTVTCKHKGCIAAFTKPTLLCAEQALRMHVGRKHDRSILPPHVLNSQKKADSRDQPESEAVRAPRKYTRRQVEPVTHEVCVNFCPNCGCNIHAVATGMAMAKL